MVGEPSGQKLPGSHYSQAVAPYSLNDPGGQVLQVKKSFPLKLPAGHVNFKSQHVSLMKPQSSSFPDFPRAFRSTARIGPKRIAAIAAFIESIFTNISLIKLLI